jgi:hypothetical protein
VCDLVDARLANIDLTRENERLGTLIQRIGEIARTAEPASAPCAAIASLIDAEDQPPAADQSEQPPAQPAAWGLA